MSRPTCVSTTVHADVRCSCQYKTWIDNTSEYEVILTLSLPLLIPSNRTRRKRTLSVTRRGRGVHESPLRSEEMRVRIIVFVSRLFRVFP
jgi:hypothetical protein